MRNVEYFGCYEGPKGMSIALEVECFVCVCVGGGVRSLEFGPLTYSWWSLAHMNEGFNPFIYIASVEVYDALLIGGYDYSV